MASDDLHTRLAAEIVRRMAVARAATPGPWTTPGPDTVGEWMIYGSWWAVAHAIVSDYHGDAPALQGGPDGEQANSNAEHIALHDPADALRRYERDRRVLERHGAIDPYDLRCRQCYEGSPWPCDEIRDLAESYGLASTPTEEAGG